MLLEDDRDVVFAGEEIHDQLFAVLELELAQFLRPQSHSHSLILLHLRPAFAAAKLADEGRPRGRLIVFIDEVGGPKTRQRILEVALEALDLGYRVLVTGRPTGFADLSHPPELFELLARRPIFLALMALVNCTENRMPEGRAKLYERIVELYLGRQERFRQRKAFTDGSPLPRRWTPDETRRVLAAVASESMEKGSEAEKRERETDKRRFTWPRAELEQAVRGILERDRFPTLRPDDAPTLVKFFLHPAGWGLGDDELRPIADRDLERGLAGFPVDCALTLSRPGTDASGAVGCAGPADRRIM